MPVKSNRTWRGYWNRIFFRNRELQTNTATRPKLQELGVSPNRRRRSVEHTLQASANAKPPPSKIITLHGICLWTVGQSRSGFAGPGGLLSTHQKTKTDLQCHTNRLWTTLKTSSLDMFKSSVNCTCLVRSAMHWKRQTWTGIIYQNGFKIQWCAKVWDPCL